MLSPLHRLVVKNIKTNALKGRILRNFWSAVFSIGTMVLIIFPLSMVVRIFFRQFLELGHFIQNFLNNRPEYISELYEKIAKLISGFSSDQFTLTANDIEVQVKSFLSNEMQRMVYMSRNIIQNIGSFAGTMLLMMFSMFFFYADGPYLANLVLRAVPIRQEYLSTLIKKFKDITRNLFLGYIIVALLQAVLAYVIYRIFNIQGSLVLSVLTFMLVFIPMFGATIIYIPLSIIKIANGNVAQGIIFFVVCVIFLSGIDNVLRPFFLKDRIQLHPLIIFFAILGGLFAFGFNGFILGPVFVILFLTVLDLFLTEHKIDNKEIQ
jgi:predicted PurR-regulated permease PerM